MPAPFKRLSLEQFSALLERFQFTRRINAVHMHHTWRPDHRQFKGHDSIVGMWNYHTKHNGWSDIAQHITIDPDGFIWLGRNWNTPPASASGQNGNSKAGPFMFEMIGDFDRGCDKFVGKQRHTALSVIAMIQKQFGLLQGSLMFHNMMSGKTCPGDSIDYQETLIEIETLKATMGVHGPRGRNAPYPQGMADMERIVDDAVEDLNRVPSSQIDPADAEPCADKQTNEHTNDFDSYNSAGHNGDTARAVGLTTSQLQALRAHVINLTMGEFSTEGEWKTSKGDVDAIFNEHLTRALTRATELRRPLRIVVQAHGGLISEAAGLAIAHKSVDWWISNGIYPIYFIWETGAFETIGQLLRRSRDGVARDLARDIFDYTTDPLIQETARALQGPRIWGGMKLSAQLASSANILGNLKDGGYEQEGGAYYVARKLGEFCKKHGDTVQVHAVGHSAGSVFHAYFIPAAVDFGVKNFRTLHLLAPAMRVDLFKAMLKDRVGQGKGIEEITIYTMHKDFEVDDHCAKVYRKSLLYLIYHALEPHRKAPILGLEECLREDPELAALFGLHGKEAPGQVVWSPTTAPAGRSASKSTTHGGFDDDGPTMGSVARRILGRQDADHLEQDYVTGSSGSRGADLWDADVSIPYDVNCHSTTSRNRHERTNNMQSRANNSHFQQQFQSSQGRRRALCVGINDYPTAPLYGCVADVASWTRSLRKLGFEDITAIHDQQATRAAIVGQLEHLVQSSSAGDVIVFQFSGHGTQLADLDGDEDSGDTPGLDEALCPYDFASGAFLIDDDIGHIFNRLPSGVNLTCFIDCCHSGTVSRFGVGANLGNITLNGTSRKRFVIATRDLQDAHRAYRSQVRQSRATRRGAAQMREVVFSACMSHEVAWESNGQGEFTVRATRILDSELNNLSNAQFAEQVTKAFGASPRQQPRLYTSEELRSLPLMQPLVQGHSNGSAAQPHDGFSGHDFLLHGMKQLIDECEKRH